MKRKKLQKISKRGKRRVRACVFVSPVCLCFFGAPLGAVAVWKQENSLQVSLPLGPSRKALRAKTHTTGLPQILLMHLMQTTHYYYIIIMHKRNLCNNKTG